MTETLSLIVFICVLLLPILCLPTDDFNKRQLYDDEDSK